MSHLKPLGSEIGDEILYVYGHLHPHSIDVCPCIHSAYLHVHHDMHQQWHGCGVTHCFVFLFHYLCSYVMQCVVCCVTQHVVLCNMNGFKIIIFIFYTSIQLPTSFTNEMPLESARKFLAIPATSASWSHVGLCHARLKKEVVEHMMSIKENPTNSIVSWLGMKLKNTCIVWWIWV